MLAVFINAAERIFGNVLAISPAVTAVVVPLLLLAPLTDKRWRVTWRYAVFVVLAFRLIIPFRLEFNSSVQLPVARETQAYISATREFMQNQSAQVIIPNVAPKRFTITFSQAAALIWTAGAVSMMMWHLTRYAVCSAALARERTAADMECRYRVYETQMLNTPVLMGFFRPKIYLPRGMYTHAEAQKVIAHETAHLKRADLWVKLLFTAALSMHWFNPVVYIMINRAAKDMEYSCDYAVLRGKGTDFKREYADAILKTIKSKED